MQQKNLNKNMAIYLLVLIIFLGAFLRFFDIGSESFWLDEGTTALTIKKHNALEIIQNVKEKGQILPTYYSYGKYRYDEDLPAYYVLLSGWVGVFGMSEIAFRSFSAIFGILALTAVFYLARYLFDEKTALLATFLSAINLILLWYSREARQYSYLLFMSLLSVILLLKLIKEGKARHLAGLVIVNAFIIYSHFPWLMFVFFEGLYALYIIYLDYTQKRILHKKVIAAFLIMALLYLPIIGRAIFSETLTTNLYGKPDIGQIAKFGVQLSTWLYPSVGMRQEIYDSTFNFSFFEWSLLLSSIATAILFGLLFLYGIKKSFYKKNSAIFLLFMFFIPIIVALTLSWLHPAITVFMIKQMIYIIPAFLIFVSVGISKTRFIIPLIVIIAILNVLPIFAYYHNIDKQQFREAAQFLPKDEPIFINIETAQVIFQYYYGESGNVVGVSDVEDIKKKLENVDSFWMLLTFTKYSDPEGSIKKYLDVNYELIEENDNFFDIRLLHYKRK
ncbi:glycosyltransferase family 39 protein [Candidatus Woesearchaeota archaeon]|nr:glycosyltransferase family 39 protein [Candidatus Woesearchaeota archaeon]